MLATPLQLLYFADPMCSWCYGFAPIMDQIRSQFLSQLPCRAIMGGLRVGETHVLTKEYRARIVHHWHEVHQKTGQTFNYTTAAPEGFVYNTEPPSRALVTVRRYKPDQQFDYLALLHQTFYVRGSDITDYDCLSALATEIGFSAADFQMQVLSAHIKRETRSDFALAEQLQAKAFPSIVLRHAQEFSFLTIGYQDYAQIEPLISSWLEKHRAA